MRSERLPEDLPRQIVARRATEEDVQSVRGAIHSFCETFGLDEGVIDDKPFHILTPNSANPYRQLYTHI